MAKQTYVVLLRGVMPTGKNKVPMARLREVLTKAGFDEVRTYIQSGNALVVSEMKPKDIEANVRALIKKHIGADLAVMVRTGAALQRILHEQPFKKGHDASRIFFGLFQEKPPRAALQTITDADYGEEELVVVRDTAYLYIPETFGKGKLSGAFLERKLSTAVTVRNLNTMTKLAALAMQKTR